MKKLSTAALTIVMLLGMITTAFAQNYEFASGPSSADVFAKATTYDEPAAPDPLSANERRNKDAALNPPVYGVFGGEIATDPTSFFHYNVLFFASSSGAGSSEFSLRENAAEILGEPRGFQGAAPLFAGFFGEAIESVVSPNTYGLVESTSVVNTEALYFGDGTIGKLKVDKTGKLIPVYEGATLGNLAKGAGHFASTSAWDGNICLVGHNRGAGEMFGFAKNLSIGDKLTYTTPYGSRIYAVFNIEKISETDDSKLGYSAENILTLLTCVENIPALRLCVQAREII
ncbi:MAG: class D sortase [Clostridiales bacterium]|nr:class D sortase [Clostridiales bacterium]